MSKSLNPLDDHAAVVEHFLALMASYVSPGPVVHVGAHHGEEVSSYLAYGYAPILLIEADPTAIGVLNTAFSLNPKITVRQYAVCELSGIDLEFNINLSRNGSSESSSLLDLKDLSQIVPTLHTSRTARVPAARLDDIVADAGFKMDELSLLNVDVQGAELRVFHGSHAVLQCVPAVLAEVNMIEMYDGCPLREEVDHFLAEYSLKPVESLLHELYDEAHSFPAWGECLYLRENLLTSA